ncbi:MAG: 23S rRNA (pseudouridine(1915)-N(3))-methyltransferase RlmH [Chitinophagaceae bacterium]|jgi:23S rRNA (pseudouridine1915-N3)-methyltransferase|nr:23S rRNA (pseudouridine(1915)-N(3))-methyltransferase RlmH [Chitinophagaceae bacterium]
MKLIFWSIGSKHEVYVKDGIEMFTKRINNYYSVEWKIMSPPKNAAAMEETIQRDAESRMLLDAIDPNDFIILLDERGRALSSPDLADLIQQRANAGTKKLHFIIGGAFGVNDALRKRANFTWQLSRLVFPHQLVRLILSEQVYRACTINKGEKYHHI